MQDKKDCTSPSSPSSSPNAHSNAFSRDFLDKLHDREEAPFAALECEARGPWVAIERPVAGAVHRGERWAVHRSWENPKTDRPAATFTDRELAFLFAAGQEVGGRRSILAISREPEEGGGTGQGTAVLQLDLEGQLQIVGHLAVYDEDTFRAFQVLETLLRASEPLAQVLDAAGGSIVELVGRRLMVG